MADEDMPFAMRTGITPDIILSPEALPSRMTNGMLMEILAGKAACLQGQRADATPFCGQSTDELSRVLVENGYEKHGYETMICGTTGNMLKAQIFMGPCYYEALKHLVEEKIHARARGPRHPLNRQPTEGKSRGGGHRFGEMERDVLISHGASSVLQGRTNASDATIVVICNKCGNLADKARPSSRSITGLQVMAADNFCRFCQSGADCHEVALPYATVLLSHEISAMNVAPRFDLEKKVK